MSTKTNTRTGLAGEIGKKGTFANLQQETLLNLMRTHAVLTSEFKQKLFRPIGLSHEKYNVLRILAGENRAMQIYEVAERMIAPKTDISRLVVHNTKCSILGLVAERDILRERVDCHLNRLYELLQDTRDEVDAFNVICHRPKGE